MAKNDATEGPVGGYKHKNYNPEDTQPTNAMKKPSQPPQVPEDDPIVPKKLQFGWGSLALLIILIWAAEALGTALPGPLDDMLYEAIAALFFGFIQYLRSILYKK